MTPPVFDDPHTAQLHAALRAMPTPRAPHTLAPRVMALVSARLAAQAVAARTWFEWSVPAQLASGLAFLLLVAGAALIWPSVELWMEHAASWNVVRLVSVLFRAIWQPVMVWVVSVMTITILFCATVGAVLGRLALGGASR